MNEPIDPNKAVDFIIKKAGEFAKAGTTVKVSGNTLSGDTDGEPFRIDLQPAGDRAAGTVTIGG